MRNQVILLRAPCSKIIYVPCPKNASTSVMIWLSIVEAQFAGFPPSNLRRKDAKRYLSFDRINLTELPHYLSRHSDHYLFAIYRSPYSRIVSAYLDKVNRLVKRKMPRLYWRAVLSQAMSGPANWGNNKYAIAFMKSKLTFSSFVEALEAAGVGIDPHYQLQSELMPPSPLAGGRFFDLKDFADRLPKEVATHTINLQHMTSSTPHIIPTIPRRNSSTAKLNYESFYTPKIRKVVEDLYMPDFAAFGYN